MSPLMASLDDYVDAFEEARRSRPEVDLEAFHCLRLAGEAAPGLGTALEGWRGEMGPNRSNGMPGALDGARPGIFQTCANPRCGSSWLKLWRSRSGPVFVGGWSCSAACTAASCSTIHA